MRHAPVVRIEEGINDNVAMADKEDSVDVFGFYRALNVLERLGQSC